VQVAAVRERHRLRGARPEPAVVPERVGMEELAADDVGQRLDVLVRMERPFAAGDDPVVIEHTQRANAHLVRVTIAVEREVPPGVEPAALLVPDRVGFTDDDIGRLRLHGRPSVDPMTRYGSARSGRGGVHDRFGPDLEEIRVKAVEPFLPGLSILLDPLRHFVEGLGRQPTWAPLRSSTLLDETGALENLEMLRDRGQAEIERCREFLDGRITRREPSDDRSPRRVGERGERGTERIGLRLHWFTDWLINLPGY
jgi:hypothetical protein